MKTDPPAIVDIEGKVKLYVRITFIVLIIAGAIAYYFFRNEDWGGVGLATSLFSIISVIHFSNSREKGNGLIDTKMSWFLLVMVLLGLVIMLLNRVQGGPEFYRGIGAGLAFVSGISFAIELMMNWLDNVR